MFKNITLEVSLKPFKETSDEYITKVCKNIFDQWRPLIKNRKTISVLMWSSDGSELLDYSGNLDDKFEWCYFVGTANNQLLGDMPEETSLHERKRLYIPNPPEMTYNILKKIVITLKEEGKKAFPDSDIRVGTTFDIGPEFAISDFKYKRHPEICNGTGCDRLGFVDATANLNADDFSYASYPDGIPQDTPMGTFLGKQARIFMQDMNFDYIWLSNGMGFCYEPWRPSGKIYDGKNFHPEKLDDTRKKIFMFWKLFRDACPDFPIETRGTNYSVGIDYASDGVPLYEIYNGNFNITPPPNSPWAAIDDNIGIELLGQLTRNCELPGKDYMFRFYLHDIWWMNSPWYDRYESMPYDIYLPMAVSIINKDGNTQSPSLLNLLSIDNSKGDMPDQCAYEVIPHLLKAEKDSPDSPAPLVLVYPFKEYTTCHNEDTLKEMYFGDTFLQDALNSGFPLASAVSAENFSTHPLSLYQQSTLVVPAVINNKEAEAKISDFAKNGGGVIVYGSDTSLEKIDFPCQKVSIYNPTDNLFKAWEAFGYSVCHTGHQNSEMPSMTIHKSNNAMIFSVYNRDTTVKSKFKFPLGAPVLNGFNTEIKDGYAVYSFNRSVHTECHAFVKQDGGVVRAKEEHTASHKYRRRIKIFGLENADIALFGEEYCKKDCIVTRIHPDQTLIPMDGWEVIEDEKNGTYLYGHNISGDISICMPAKPKK